MAMFFVFSGFRLKEAQKPPDATSGGNREKLWIMYTVFQLCYFLKPGPIVQKTIVSSISVNLLDSVFVKLAGLG
jgi:hypothetical protein